MTLGLPLMNLGLAVALVAWRPRYGVPVVLFGAAVIANVAAIILLVRRTWPDRRALRIVGVIAVVIAVTIVLMYAALWLDFYLFQLDCKRRHVYCD